MLMKLIPEALHQLMYLPSFDVPAPPDPPFDLLILSSATPLKSPLHKSPVRSSRHTSRERPLKWRPADLVTSFHVLCPAFPLLSPTHVACAPI